LKSISLFQKKHSIKTSHKTNIFSAKFLPQSCNQKIVSCASGGTIQLHDITKTLFANNEHRFLCHGEKTVYEVRTLYQDPFTFTSCGHDGTCKWFDLRQSTKCFKEHCYEHTLIKLSTGISAIALNPFVPYHLVVAGLDGIVRFYDRRMLTVGSGSQSEDTNPPINDDETNQSTKGLFSCFSIINDDAAFNSTVISNKKISSLQYDNWGRQLVVSYQPDTIFLIDWRVKTNTTLK
jgi:DDB1- and CUL4-associated factor 6